MRICITVIKIMQILFLFSDFRTPPNAINGSRAAMLERWHQCPPEHRPYHKGDFFRLATGMGVRYREVLQHSLVDLALNNDNHLAVKGVVVNSSHILEELNLLRQNPQDKSQHYTSHNGKEGVHPYRIGWLGVRGYLYQRLKATHRHFRNQASGR